MLRRIIPRRAAAAVATGVLALTGAVVFSTPAHADVVEYTSACTNDFLGPVGETPTKVDIQISPVKDKYTVGDQITVSWKWLAYNKVPDLSPLPTVPENTTKPFGDITVGGAQTGVLGVDGPQIHPAANKGEELKVADMTGTLTLTSPGTVTLTPKGYRTVTNYIAVSTTTCIPAPGQVPGVGSTLTVEGAPTPDPVLSAPEGSHVGFEIDLTGTNFAPNATPQVALCAADGGNCDAGKFVSNTLAIDGQGTLSGKARLGTSGIPVGAYAVKVSDGTKSALDSLNITAYVPPDPRSGLAEPAAGPVDTVVHLTGKGWTPNSNVNIVATKADGSLAGTTLNAFTNYLGEFTADYTVTSAETTQIRVREGISSVKRVFVPFSVVTVPPLSQGVTATLAAGPLSMSQAGTGIDFGTATLNGEVQTLTGSLNQVTVTDARGGNLGWSLTGTMTDLVAANGTDKIPAGNIAWTPSCAAAPGSLSEVANGTAGPLSSTASMLCSVTANGTTTGGKFTADAQMALTTPQFAAAGAYSGTLTLTLV